MGLSRIYKNIKYAVEVLTDTSGYDTLDPAVHTNVQKIVDYIDDNPVFLGDGFLSGLADGLAITKPDYTLIESGGTVYLEAEALGGGDIQYQVDGEIGTLDCTTGAGTGGKARVALTAGADVNTEEENYIYVTRAGSVLTLAASTSKPTGAFGWLAKVTIQDATTFAAEGPLGNQRTTESVNDSRGQISHERERIRFGTDTVGIVPTVNITTNVGTPDNFHLEVTGGEKYQLHRQTWPAFTTGPYYYGNGINIFEKETDLNGVLTEADGTSTSGKYFIHVFWGTINKNTGDCKIFVNQPNGSYNIESNALADANNTADYSVPDSLASVAFMIAKVVMRHQTTSGGTWTEIETIDLRGTPLGLRSGGSTALPSATSFSDSTFSIFDDGDPTKEVDFQVSGITPATTRTITAADEDIDMTPDTGSYKSAQTVGIADDNLLEVDGTPNAAEYARFTANGLEGRTEAEFKADFNLEIGTDVQAYDAELAAVAGLTSAANKVPRFTGSGTADLLDFNDEDDMSSDSATALASQQSIKAYVDGIIYSEAISLGDEITSMTIGTAKATFRFPFAATITEVRASVTTAPTGSTAIFDINEGGVSILSTKLSIDAGEKTSTTAASAAVISDSAMADDAEVTIDIDQIGSTIAGTGAKIRIYYTRA